jgi:hypothetical protein
VSAAAIVFVHVLAKGLALESQALHLLILPESVLSPVVINMYPGIQDKALPSAIEEQVFTEFEGEFVLSFEHAEHE